MNASVFRCFRFKAFLAVATGANGLATKTTGPHPLTIGLQAHAERRLHSSRQVKSTLFAGQIFIPSWPSVKQDSSAVYHSSQDMLPEVPFLLFPWKSALDSEFSRRSDDFERSLRHRFALRAHRQVEISWAVLHPRFCFGTCFMMQYIVFLNSSMTWDSTHLCVQRAASSLHGLSRRSLCSRSTALGTRTKQDMRQHLPCRSWAFRER
jgi:hypothetical protein